MDTSITKNFTTTLPAPFLERLSRVAKDTGKQKNDLIMASFLYWDKARTQAHIASGYAKAKEDAEWSTLGNTQIPITDF